MLKTLLIIYLSFTYGYGFSMFLDILTDNDKEHRILDYNLLKYDGIALLIWLFFPIIFPILHINSLINYFKSEGK